MALFKRNEPMLGIDISPSAVKLIELSRSGPRFRVEAFAIESLGEGVMEDRNITDPGEVGEAIKRAWRKSGTRLRRADFQCDHACRADAGGVQRERHRSQHAH